MWALGASFYYLCMGKPVAEYHSGSWSHSWKEVMGFKCPSVVWPHHRLLNQIITAALMRDHKKRPSAAELLQVSGGPMHARNRLFIACSQMLEDFDETKEDLDSSKKRELGDTLPGSLYDEEDMEADANDGVPDPPASVEKPAKKKKTREAAVEAAPKAPAARKAKKTQVAKVKAAAAAKARPPPRYPLRNRMNNPL